MIMDTSTQQRPTIAWIEEKVKKNVLHALMVSGDQQRVYALATKETSPEMKKEAEFLRSKGTLARYTVEKGQPHRLDTLAGANAGRLFDGFEETRKGCRQ